MGHLFIHAPPGNGLDGALLYYDYKPTKWTKNQIQRICDDLFRDHDPEDELVTHNDNKVPLGMIERFMLRVEQGKMQRLNIVGTDEDLLWEEWHKRVARTYRSLTRFAAFLAAVNHTKDGKVLHAVK